ncbi:MAG: DEAD/DEAH box helicase [Saprospiraceae bacterium]|nr:DEAD/DEAH box helicase [Saprospiraceae bacterium]
MKQWVESVRNNERYVLLDDGSLGLIPDEWYEKLKQVALASDEEKGKLKISKYRFGVIDSMFEELSDVKMMKEIKSKMKQLQHYEFKKTYPVPAEVKADLREYQVLGFQWLKALNDLGFGGCLADDMGLGKTVQVLSLLADQQKQGKGTSLAIVPRSLLFNWAAEIDKFCPSLQYIHYHGPDRMLKREVLKDYDLVITTYDTATNDVEFFKDIHFNYIILDESQAIKNPASKRYKAMRLLNADNRIVMTGTPIENNTFDLYAQFSFINPGIFGSQQYFRDRFAIPIDKEQDSETAQLLKKMINPFLMRRTKEQVATDLPERVENIIYCEMDSVQRSFYDSLKNTIKSEIESAVFSKGFDKARFKIIEGLLRLRQVCNAPQLVDPSLPVHKRSSVKIETLLDIVENDLGNHNALIFSQFTSMLDIVRAQLDKKEIKYAYLDGSTKDRKGAVEYFEQNEDVKLFLLSLKAGNTGLNLTKADYVYLIDPWWNPAVEAQAIDRTHRIGQTKNVFAYKMICKNTIEEKIVELQSKKKKLASELVVTDENVFKSLDKEEIIALFD